MTQSKQYILVTPDGKFLSPTTGLERYESGIDPYVLNHIEANEACCGWGQESNDNASPITIDLATCTIITPHGRAFGPTPPIDSFLSLQASPQEPPQVPPRSSLPPSQPAPWRGTARRVSAASGDTTAEIVIPLQFFNYLVSLVGVVRVGGDGNGR